MKIHIFDVEHGECNAIETPTGELILIGVGHNSSTNWRPSSWVRQRGLRPSCIVLSNLDCDHVSDLPNFESDLQPESIKFNHYLTPEWVAAIKIDESGEIHDAILTALHWMKNVFTGNSVTPEYGFEKLYFYHSPSKFQDTNNLSVVTFIRYGACGIMFPGDLELAGWREHLTNPVFANCLRNTNILVASHHGRLGGYCPEIFEHCAPHAVIISDKSVVHDTQNHNRYAAHCIGIQFPQSIRKVLTTRSDGKITIDVPATGGYTVYTNQPY